MKMKHLFGAVAACGLLAGAAYAQDTSSSTGAVNDPNASAPMSGPATTGAGAQTDAPSSAATQPGAASNDMSSSNMSSSTSSSTMPSSTSAAPAGDMSSQQGVSATTATTYGQGASATVTTTTNGPVPDTPENRKKYGKPMSHAGRHSAAKGN